MTHAGPRPIPSGIVFPADPRSGFTLIEVVVGLAVGGIVLMTGFAALAAVQDRSQHAMDATTQALEGATARATLVEWLATARLQSSELGVRFYGIDAQGHGLEWDELTFVTPAPTPVNAPTTAVRLVVDTDPLTPERGLVAELHGRMGDEPLRMELVPQVTGLVIRYLPPVEGPVEWTESWAGQGELPRGVRITLLDDPADPLPPLLRHPILVPMATLR